MSERAAIALGSNMENPEAQVRRAFEEIAELPDTKIVARSRLHRTRPVGYADQPDFVNAMVLVETSLEPRPLLDALLEIEKMHGRVRTIPNGPRSLDLDIILYGDRVISEPGLTVPHPRAKDRDFVMVPLREVWPNVVIPDARAQKPVIPDAREGNDPGSSQ
jgi:2-amino-4-hydroxy-6-hydroxymethyldihydropteridine diphosphokinase